MEILVRILADKLHRVQLIKQFQEQIWNGHDRKNERETAILSELAYDLDLYEPDETLRNEDSSYYGDERLEEEIKAALLRLKE